MTSKFLNFFHRELNIFSVQIADINDYILFKCFVNQGQSLDISNYLQGIYLITDGNKELIIKHTFKI